MMPADWLDAGLEDALNDVAANVLFGSRVVLLTGATPITPSTTLAMLTEAAFTGYARQTSGPWGAAALQIDGHWKSQSGAVIFNNTGGVGATVTGWGLIDQFSTRLFIAGYFAAPITIPAAGAFVFTPYVQDITE